MNSLELRLPPPLVLLIVAVVMWGVSRVTPASDLPPWHTTLAIILALLGVSIAIAGIVAFRKAKTTGSPTKPQAASALVVTGVYKFTRNPMYLGLCIVLVAWTAYLWSGWALLGPVAFIGYIGRYQIEPEERALSAHFGDDYREYRSRVRRWL